MSEPRQTFSLGVGRSVRSAFVCDYNRLLSPRRLCLSACSGIPIRPYLVAALARAASLRDVVSVA